MRHILLPGDLADEAVCQEWIDKTIKELGKIDILVNNASTQEQSMESFTQIKRWLLSPFLPGKDCKMCHS